MSWYKTANLNIQVVSFNSYGELRVLINGTVYTYYDVSPFWERKIEWMINNKKIPRGNIMKVLKRFSNPEKHKEYNNQTDILLEDNK